ncbi:MAG: hypothetical protein V4692_14765 [Bdellovibrionota bacterium]
MVFLTLLLVSFANYAQASDVFYTPQEALDDALSSKLEFVGTYIPAYSETRLPSGIFKNDKVLISTDYCISGKVQAASIRLHPVDTDRGNLRIYAEVDRGTDISDGKRSDYYDISWSLGARQNNPGFTFDTTPANYKKYVEKEIRVMAGCVTGMSTKIGCQPGSEHQAEAWGASSYPFWKNPGEKWYELLRELRAQCELYAPHS